MRLLTGIVIAGALVAVTACGGGGNGEKSGTTATTGATTAPKPKPKIKASALKPKVLVRCLKKAGEKPILIPAPPAGAPGSEFESIGSVRVNVSKTNGVVAIFFPNAELAGALRKSPLGARGAAQVIGTVYLASNRGRPKQLKVFRTCLRAQLR